MKTPTFQHRAAAFSLVEVTVAIGIFAFVVVGILGLIPTALKLRAESAQETQAVLIAEELLAAVRASSSITNVIVRDGPALQERNNRSVNLDGGQVAVLGYAAQTTVPYYFWGPGDRPPGPPWFDGQLGDATDNDITTLARISATRIPGSPGLYRVEVQVRTPAMLALTNTQPITLTTLFYSPSQ